MRVSGPTRSTIATIEAEMETASIHDFTSGSHRCVRHHPERKRKTMMTCVWRIYILTEKRINRGRGSSTPHQREPIERTMDDRRRVEKRTEVRNARCTVSAERIPFPPRGSRDAIPCLKRRDASERTRTSCRRRTRRSDGEASSVGRRGKHGESTSVVDGNRMPEGRGW